MVYYERKDYLQGMACELLSRSVAGVVLGRESL